MKLLLLSFFLGITILLNGQYEEPKFGKIEMADLSMVKYDKDTTAGALVLFDKGKIEFILNSDAEFQTVYRRHCQVKIFKKSAFSIGDISLRLHNSGSSKEDLRNLQAVTYNLIEGKIVKTKLDNDNLYKADGKNYTDIKFAFPEIKEGSIIEFSYSITSDYLYNLRGWTFQYVYPARWSQYSYVVPEYFNYRESSKGYLPFDIIKKKNGTTYYSIVSTSDGGGLNSGSVKQTTTINPSIVTNILGIKDVPAFVSEPNIDCEENYIQSLEFELSSIQYPNSIRKDYTRTWESVNKEMKDDNDFGMLLKTNGFIKDTVAILCNNKQNENDKAISIYNYVQKRMKWNEDYRVWATKGLKKPFSDRIGSSAEINLLLTMMLQTAGLKANPVIFSTRDNGIAVTFYPTITKFNSVLTQLEIGGKTILLDATSKYCPFGVLPASDINGQGRIVNDYNGDWVTLNTDEKYKEIKNYNLEINSDGKLTGSITGNYEGYAGIEYRNSLELEKNYDDYFRKVQENLKGLTINKFAIADRFSNFKPLCDTLNVEITDHVDIIGDKILFNPLLYETIKKNRYTLEERKYPVDYNYPISEAYTFDYSIPSGYFVESLPQPVSLKLPDNSIAISYNAQNIGNKIHIEYRRDISKILFLPSEYKKLKELYDQIVKKHSEQIILKKTS